MLTLVLWQHVVFLSVSRTLFRMSLVMVVRRMLCSVSLNAAQHTTQTHAAQHATHNHNQAQAVTAPKLTQRSNSLNVLNYNFSKKQSMHPEDDRVIETCSSVLNVLTL